MQVVIYAVKHDRDWNHFNLSLDTDCHLYRLHRIQFDCRKHYHFRPNEGLGSMHKVRARHQQNLGVPYLYFIVRRKDSLVLSNLQFTISLNVAFLRYLLWVSPFFHVRWRCSHLFEHLHMLSYWCSGRQKSSWSFFAIYFAVVHSHVLQRSGAFTGPMVLFEGSPSRSANREAIVEPKLMPAAINQFTPTIEYNPFTESLAPFSILIASAANFTI